MTLLKLKPTREVLMDSALPSHLSNLFSDLFNDSVGSFERNVHFTPRTDVVEKEKSYELHVSLPGLKKEEIGIEVENDMLVISGERKQNNESKTDKYHSVENFYGRFKRSFSLPDNADLEKISAELTDGILKIEIFKSETKQNKTSVVIK